MAIARVLRLTALVAMTLLRTLLALLAVSAILLARADLGNLVVLRLSALVLGRQGNDIMTVLHRGKFLIPLTFPGNSNLRSPL